MKSCALKDIAFLAVAILAMASPLALAQQAGTTTAPQPAASASGASSGSGATVVIVPVTGASGASASSGSGITIPVSSAGVEAQVGGVGEFIKGNYGAGARFRLGLDNGTQRNFIVVSGALQYTNAGALTGELKTSAIPFQDTAGTTLFEMQPVELQFTTNAAISPGYGGWVSSGVHLNLNKTNNEDYFTITAKPLEQFTDRNNGAQNPDGLNAVNIRGKYTAWNFLVFEVNGMAGILNGLSTGTSSQTGVGTYLSADGQIRFLLPKNFYAGAQVIAENTQYKLVTAGVNSSVNETSVMGMINAGFHFDIGNRPAAKPSSPSGAPATALE